ncbi:MAG: hypothetical protein ACYDAR_15890, partial [Thermomicrobiales bacterium]
MATGLRYMLRCALMLGGAVLVFLALALFHPLAASAATLTVTTAADETVTNDAPSVSLREAIISINNQADTGADVTANRVGAYGINDTINFSIPGGGVKTISLGSSLPTIIKPVTINGYTQPLATANTLANSDNAVILIQLDGTSAGTAVNGLTINTTTGTSLIKGLAIVNFLIGLGSGGNGIVITTGVATITGNFIGTNPAGTAALANTGSGVVVSSGGSTIGGTTPDARNIISGNGGRGLETNSSNNTIVQGNFIGVGADGVTKIGNGSDGIAIVLGLANNQIGGTVAGARNVISGNGGRGLA